VEDWKPLTNDDKDASATPNIVHFIYVGGRPYSFVNYLSVRAAHKKLRPDAIYMHCTQEPIDNPHWEAIRPYVTIKNLDDIAEFGGHKVIWPHYKSDIARIQILIREGGVYLDNDEIVLRDFSHLRCGQTVMSYDAPDTQSLAASFIMAPKDARFLHIWFEKMKDRIGSGTWADHAVVLPGELAKQHPDLIKTLNYKSFVPFHWDNKTVFGDDPSAIDLSESYGMHMWDTFWSENLLSQVDEAYLSGSNSVFASLMRSLLVSEPTVAVEGGKAMETRKLKIAVYAISKNEEMFVERFCEAAKDADLISISDTGSTDGTVEIARKCGAAVSHICITPWRFDHARNTALALIPRDIDVCVSLDLDEVLQPGWREEIERVWKLGETTRLRYMFDWGAGIAFKYEKIHARHGYHWHHPCHEYPVPDGRIKEVWADTDMLLVVHKPDPTKSRGQYLDLLELSVKEDPDCPRNAFYYARELSFHRKWKEAIDACNTYLKLPRADWPNERCYAYRVMGRCYAELGDQWNAERSFQMAAYEAPNTREPWCELAMLMYRQQRWEECFAATKRALRITNREMVYTVDPEVWGAQPHDLASISAWHLGLKDVAIQQAKIAVELAPNDLRLRANLDFMLKEKSDGILADT